MERWSRHRYALVLPFVAFVLIALLGGILNGATARGRLLDAFTEEGVKDAQLSVGQRTTWSTEDGSYVFENVPRTTSIRVDAGGYLRTSAPPVGGDVRLSPLSVTVQVNEEGITPAVGVASAQIRQETRVLNTADASGRTVVSPHPGRDAKVLICAAGFASKEVTIRGVTLVAELRRDAAGDCPPLPTPTPDPNATPSPSPSPSASPAATPSPSPTGP